MECYSCGAIAGFHFVINNRLDFPLEEKRKVIAMCCRDDLRTDTDGTPMNFPAVPIFDTPEETLSNFIAMRANTLVKGKWGGAEGIKRDPKFACYHCKEWRKADWRFSPFIAHINFSLYPSPCQCNCIYCWVHPGHWDNVDAPFSKENYEKVFEIVRLAKKDSIIAPRGISGWQISSGEISIHPRKAQIMDLVKGERVRFFTNACVFDKDIARELRDNPNSSINISIDSGTPETWHKVKGLNNFEHVIKNLFLYRENSTRPEQITVKYMILPGINDSDKDFVSCANILRALNVQSIMLSRDNRAFRKTDVREKFRAEELVDDKIVESTARFLAICTLFGIKVIPAEYYTQTELSAIGNLTNKLLNEFVKKNN